MTNVTNLPDFDPASKIRGCKRSGTSVFVDDNRVVPHLVMHDHGAMIEFILDGRLSFEFPREWSLLAATFAGQAMAVGAGHPSLSSPHKSSLPFAPKAVKLG